MPAINEEDLRILLIQLMEETSDAVLIIEAQTARMVYCNQGACRELGYSREELLALRAFDFAPVFNEEATWHYFINNVLRPQKIMCGSTESLMKRKDGSIYPCGGTGALLKHKEKEYMVCVFRNLNDDKQLQEHRLQYEKLLAVNQLASGIAHELNNPLAGILMSIENIIYEAGGRDPKIQPALNDIKNLIQRCKTIVDGLLKFSQLRPEGVQIIDPRLTVIDVFDSLQSEAQQKKIRLINAMGAQTPDVRANELALREILVHILMNSFDAMPEGGTVTISARPIHKDRLVIEITDMGEGIESIFLKKIFDPFFTTKPPGRGIGLGLYTSARLTQNFGGTIDAFSKGKGQGTTISLTLWQKQASSVDISRGK